MAKQAYRVRNWRDYNKALVNRGSLTFWFTPDVMSQWSHQGKQHRGGKIRYSELAIETSLIIKEVFNLTYRSCQGFIASLLSLLSKRELEAPHYSTLCRRASQLHIRLSKTVRQSTHQVVLVDATGIQVYGESEWKRLKHGPSKQRCWRKLHLSYDASSQQILSAQMSASEKHDMNYFTPLLEAIKQPIDCVIGDGSYDKRHCYQAVYERNSELITPPQHNARLQSENRGHFKTAIAPRDEAIKWIRAYCEPDTALKAWKQQVGYHRRSLVETAMFRLKSQFSDTVRAKSFHSQQQQLFIRCYALNKMTSLGMPQSVPA